MAENAKEKQMDKNPEVNGETEELIDDVVGEETTNEELSVLQERLSKAEEKCEEYLSMAQRRQAEFDNFRKRNRSAVSEAYEDSKLETIEQFLPVLDNLQRALDISKGAESKEAEAICAGMEKVIKQFIDILNKMGVKEIDALGQPFDPLLHDAVMQVEAQEEDERNTVVEVLLKGYRSEDKVIRYSMVKVAN